MAQKPTADGGDVDQETMFNRLCERFAATDGDLLVSEEELVALGVKEDYGVSDRENIQLNRDVIKASGTRDVDPVDYHLARLGLGQWVSLTVYSKLIDSAPKWYITGIGDIEAEGVGLSDTFGDDLDLPQSTIDAIAEGYKTEARETFHEVEDPWAAAFTGSRVHITLEEPWIGMEYVVSDLDIDDETWEYEVKPAIGSARPSNPRGLDTPMTTEFAVDISFSTESDDD